MGLLEIKTSTIHGNASQWKDRIPQNYYIQVLHGMAVTGALFAELRAHLKYSDDYTAVRTYHIERPDAEEDIHTITEGISRFWEFVEKDEMPPLVIGGLR
jgi:predicted phage-related endonuclease